MAADSLLGASPRRSLIVFRTFLMHRQKRVAWDSRTISFLFLFYSALFF
jgi:hypothetical protein